MSREALRVIQTRERVPKDILANAFELYSNGGWKLLWIAKLYGIHHTSLLFHIRRKGIVRNIRPLDKRPAEVEELYRSRRAKVAERKLSKRQKHANDNEEEDEFEVDSRIKSYREIIDDALKRKVHREDYECSHGFWIKRCSLCNKILESDKQLNAEPSLEPVHFIYHEFDKIVNSYATSLELQSLGVVQSSMLYWIHNDNRNVLTLRVKTNLPDGHDDNAIVVSAFTSQELIHLLLRLPSSVRNDRFMMKIALNGDNPLYLAKLLIRELKKRERTRQVA